MLSLCKPTPERIEVFLKTRRDAPFSYAAIGASLKQPPAGFTVDHNRVALGRGALVFKAACAALTAWEMYPSGWLLLIGRDAPIALGQVVAMMIRVCGVWSLNPCRIVAVVDEECDGVRRFGFAYGTLACHAECGEERFMVAWDLTTDTVWYDLFAFSRPRHMLAWLCFPWVRRLQRRFASDSLAAMREAVITRQSTQP